MIINQFEIKSPVLDRKKNPIHVFNIVVTKIVGAHNWLYEIWEKGNRIGAQISSPSYQDCCNPIVKRGRATQ